MYRTLVTITLVSVSVLNSYWPGEARAPSVTFNKCCPKNKLVDEEELVCIPAAAEPSTASTDEWLPKGAIVGSRGQHTAMGRYNARYLTEELCSYDMKRAVFWDGTYEEKPPFRISAGTGDLRIQEDGRDKSYPFESYCADRASVNNSHIVIYCPCFKKACLLKCCPKEEGEKGGNNIRYYKGKQDRACRFIFGKARGRSGIFSEGISSLRKSTQLKAFAELTSPPVFANSVLFSRFREGASGGLVSFFHAAPVNKQTGTPDRYSNPDLLIICSLVYCESSTLDHLATEAEQSFLI
uniref:Uncharacterized protein n=1 Tax=Timema shepardi TaxID=629360 RepID=A0A7R9AT33_TIMSH|nr:unnamed protein product [Timema shepardi]